MGCNHVLIIWCLDIQTLVSCILFIIHVIWGLQLTFMLHLLVYCVWLRVNHALCVIVVKQEFKLDTSL